MKPSHELPNDKQSTTHLTSSLTELPGISGPNGLFVTGLVVTLETVP